MVAAILLMGVGTYDIAYSTQNYIVWYFLIISLAFSLVSVAGSLHFMGFSVTGGWRFYWRMLAITFRYLAAMMVFVLLPFLTYAQLGEYLTFTRLVSVVLCAVVAVGLIRYYWRTLRRGIAPQS